MEARHHLVLRPMDFGEILDNTFQVYRSAFADLFMIGLIASLPSILTAGVAGSAVPGGSSFNLAFSAFRLVITLIFGLAAAFFLPLVQGATVALVAKSALGETVDWRGALTAGGRRYGTLLGVGLLLLLMYIVATIALVFAGLIIFAWVTVPAGLLALMVYTAFSIHAVVVEDVPGSTAAIRRSFQLVSGRFWTLVGLGIVLGLLMVVANLAVGYLTGLPFKFLGSDLGPTMVWLKAILSGAGSALTYPVLLIGQTLAYFDTRIRKEGFDLEMLARSQMVGGQQQP